VKKSLPFTFYILYFGAASFSMPFIILYLQSLGYSGAQVGLLAGLIPLVNMLGAPFWTRLADTKHCHKLIMGIAILGTIVFATMFPFFSEFSLVLIISVLYAVFLSPVIPLADSATMAMLASEKARYGRVRLGGTIGWGLMAPIAGLIIEAYGIKFAFWGFSAVMFLAFIVSQRFSYSVGVSQTPNTAGFRDFLANRRWGLFLILVFITGAGLASINSYLFPYMEELGISRSTMGLALFISTVGELPVLFLAHHLLKRFGMYGLLVMGVIITGVRLLLYAWLNFAAGILVFQLMNGMTYPMIWVAGVAYADENAPAGMKATAQGLLGAMMWGIGAATGGFTGGLLIGSVGGRWMYLIFGIVVLVSVAVITWLYHAESDRKVRSVN